MTDWVVLVRERIPDGWRIGDADGLVYATAVGHPQVGVSVSLHQPYLRVDAAQSLAASMIEIVADENSSDWSSPVVTSQNGGWQCFDEDGLVATAFVAGPDQIALYIHQRGHLSGDRACAVAEMLAAVCAAVMLAYEVNRLYRVPKVAA